MHGGGEGEEWSYRWLQTVKKLCTKTHVMLFSLSPQAQGTKEGKPKQKVIISDCGEYV